jgi:hypothetical protein
VSALARVRPGGPALALALALALLQSRAVPRPAPAELQGPARAGACKEGVYLAPLWVLTQTWKSEPSSFW